MPTAFSRSCSLPLRGRVREGRGGAYAECSLIPSSERVPSRSPSPALPFRGGGRKGSCFFESRQGQKLDRQPRASMHREVGQRGAEDGRELKAVAGEPRGEDDVRVFG